MVSHPVNTAVILSATPAQPALRTQPVNPVTPVTDATQSDSPAFTLGQKYTAQVGERLANNLSLVNVAGKWLQMRMPAAINNGDLLELTLIEQSPHLKFLLQTGTPIGDNSTTLSPTGKLLAQLLGQPALLASSATYSTAPLLPNPPATAAENAHLSAQLQHTLAISGLFYEAHLARWLKSSRSLQQLQQEPQNKLAPTSGSKQTNSTVLIAPHTTALVQQQLHLLETGTMQWQGEIWPGQTIKWDVTQLPDHEQEAEQTTDETTKKASNWQTRIQLHLPNLGKVTAILKLDPQGMRIQLNTDSDHTMQQFKREQVTLATAMQTTGLTIQALEIQRHEKS